MHPEMERSLKEVTRAMDLARVNAPRPSAHPPIETRDGRGALAVRTGSIPASSAETLLQTVIAELGDEIRKADARAVSQNWSYGYGYRDGLVKAMSLIGTRQVGLTDERQPESNIGDVGCAGEARPPHTQP